MSDPLPIVEDLAMRVADGLPVDWDEALRRSSSDADRAVVRQLQLMQTVARIHGVEGSRTGESAGDGFANSSVGPSALGTWGHLELRVKLSEGSYGELYRAWDPQLDREVALKLLKRPPSEAGSIEASKVVEEGRLLAKLRHPNVVTVYGASTHDGRIGLWMELINGRTLEQLLTDQGLLGASEAILIGIDLCRALAAVHGTGIVHRDVKAQNVMREQGGRILLMDFGAGIEPRPEAPLPGAKMTGTPFYMAPELLAGRPATQQSDVYSLGVLLHRLVSGRFPVEATSWDELRQRHERGEVELLRDARPNLPETFVAAVERATAGDPAKRFATAGQMEQALSAGGAVTTGAHVPAASQASAPPRSRQRLMIGVALTFLAAVAAILLLNPRRPDVETPGAPRSSDAAPPGPTSTTHAMAPAGAYNVAAAVYRVAMNSSVREKLAPGARLALGDRLTLEFEASTPLHVYVVNEDEAGHAYALFPLPGLEPQNPLPGGVHVLPGSRGGKALSWTVDSPGGREHLLVLASPERLVEYEAEMSMLTRPGQAAVALPEAARIRLRGLGSLSESPPASGTHSASRLFEMAQRLASESETVSGVWMRRIELENPRP